MFSHRCFAMGCGSIAALTILAGCSTARPGIAFLDVQKTIAARTGQNPQWIRDSSADEDVQQQVKTLLQNELTIEKAQKIALLNNRSLQATFEEIGISNGDLIQAGLLKNPQFGASVRFPDRPPSATNMEYSIAEDLLDLIILPLRKKVAAQQFEQTKLRVSNEVLKLIAEVKSTFYTVQAREQFLGRLRIILEANEAAAELSARQHEAGTANELDLVNQQALYSQSKLDLAQAEVQGKVERERLNRLLGLSGANTVWKVSAMLPEIPAEEYLDGELETIALSQRLDISLAKAQIELAARALSLKKKTRNLPTSLDMGVSAERDTGRQWVRGPTLSLGIPIFDRGQGQLTRHEAEFRQAQRLLEALTVQAQSEVRDANALLNSNRAAAQEYTKVLLPKRARVLVLSLQQYNFMLKGPYDLLLAKQQEAQTEHAYIDVLRDYWIARSELERAVGGKLPAGKHEAAGGPPTKNSPETKDSNAHEHHEKK